MDEETLIIIAVLVILAVVGIVLGLVNSLTNLLVTFGLGETVAGQFGSLLFFLILLGLIVLIVRGASDSSF